MLEVKNLSFSYETFSVEDVSFKLGKGEVLTLLGPNGSGKTTILKCIFGLLKPRRCCVLVDGRDLHSLSFGERCKKVGFVPQAHYPPFPYSAIDVVVMGLASQLKAFEAPKEEHYRKAEEKLRLLGIDVFKDRPYTSLSGGQLQLVLIARALVQDPEILLLDEPTAHLDFKNQVKVLTTVRKLADERGISAVLTLHDPNLALTYSDKIALIKDGKIRAFGMSDEVIVERLLEEVYGIPIRVIELNGTKAVVPAVCPKNRR